MLLNPWVEFNIKEALEFHNFPVTFKGFEKFLLISAFVPTITKTIESTGFSITEIKDSNSPAERSWDCFKIPGALLAIIGSVSNGIFHLLNIAIGSVKYIQVENQLDLHSILFRANIH